LEGVNISQEGAKEKLRAINLAFIRAGFDAANTLNISPYDTKEADLEDAIKIGIVCRESSWQHFAEKSVQSDNGIGFPKNDKKGGHGLTQLTRPKPSYLQVWHIDYNVKGMVEEHLESKYNMSITELGDNDSDKYLFDQMLAHYNSGKGNYRKMMTITGPDKKPGPGKIVRERHACVGQPLSEVMKEWKVYDDYYAVDDSWHLCYYACERYYEKEVAKRQIDIIMPKGSRIPLCGGEKKDCSSYCKKTANSCDGTIDGCSDFCKYYDGIMKCQPICNSDFENNANKTCKTLPNNSGLKLEADDNNFSLKDKTMKFSCKDGLWTCYVDKRRKDCNECAEGVNCSWIKEK